MKNCKRIIPCFLILATLFSCVAVPVHAEEYVSPNDFYSWIASRGAAGQIISQVFGPGCSANSDGRHHAKSYVWDAVAGHYLCTCDACGETFIATKSELSDSYQQQVNDMPFSGIDSEGGFIWTPKVKDLCFNGGYGIRHFPYGQNGGYNEWQGQQTPIDTSTLWVDWSKGCMTCTWGKLSDIWFTFDDVFPCDGYFDLIQETVGYGSAAYRESTYQTRSYFEHGRWYKQWTGYEGQAIPSDSTISLIVNYTPSTSYADSSRIYFKLPRFNVKVMTGSVNNYQPLSVDSRPATISGNLNFYDIDGTLKLAPDVHIVNETSKTVYNPVTNETYDMSGWQYDYSTRSYNITTNEGDTVNVTYGDENITIQKGGETYNLYYTVNNNGGGACQHEYVVSRENPPTCTSFGSRIYTCTKCNDTYSEVVPALGHDWQFVETVKAVTDESGVEITPAYDLYRCSRCNEEIKVGVGEKPSDEKPETPADAGSWSALFKWLDDFKIWLGEMLGNGDSDKVKTDDDGKPIITIEDEDGNEQEISLNDIKAKFQWWRDVAEIGNMFLEEVSASEQQAYTYSASMNRNGTRGAVPTGAPSIKIDLGAAQSNYGYQYGGEVEMLDLSWYTPYKKTVDDLVSGFLWILFLWNLFKRAPSIISGGEMVNNQLDDIDRGTRKRK